MKLIKEFKDFAVKGNMLDMAIGIIIGASFNSVINVLVKNIILPPLSLMSDGINFQEKKLILRTQSETTSQVSIDYGLFAETILDFLIVGFTIFIVVKFVNKLKTKADNVKDMTVATPADVQLLSDIKELLKIQNHKLVNSLAICVKTGYIFSNHIKFKIYCSTHFEAIKVCVLVCIRNNSYTKSVFFRIYNR